MNTYLYLLDKVKISWLIKLILIQFVVIVVLLSFKINKYNDKPTRIQYHNKAQSTEDSFCNLDANNEWIELDSRYFFKKNSSFYFIDAHVIRVNMILKESAPLPKFSLFITYVDSKSESGIRKYEHIVNETTLSLTPSYYSFQFAQIEASINLQAVLANNLLDINNVSADFYIKNSVTGSFTNQAIRLEIKYINHDVKNELSSKIVSNSKRKSLICAKCIYLKPSDYQNFKWWIELNRKIGYDHIEICNQSIPNTNEFNHLFDYYKDFITLKHLVRKRHNVSAV